MIVIRFDNIVHMELPTYIKLEPAKETKAVIDDLLTVRDKWLADHQLFENDWVSSYSQGIEIATLLIEKAERLSHAKGQDQSVENLLSQFKALPVSETRYRVSQNVL